VKPYYEQDGIVIYHGDCREVLPNLRESCELVFTSPPYPGAKMWKMDDADIWALNLAVIDGSIDAIREGGVLAWQVADVPSGDHGVMTTTTTTTTTTHAVCQRGLKWRSHIIWDKGITNPLPPACFMRRPAVLHLTHEHVLVFHKGGWTPREKHWRVGMSGDWRLRSVWTIAPESASAIGHIAPFPEKLSRRVIDLFSLEGETVLDPFCGSGTTLLSAKMTGRKAIGIEVEERYCEIAVKRLAQGALPLEMGA
jgi:site-specific DNA-methyltransferase (adenine-specific)